MGRRRSAHVSALLCSAALATSHASAQRSPAPAAVTYEEIKSVGTPDEAPLLKALATRLRAKFADAAFVKSVQTAIANSKTAEAVRLISAAANESGAEVEIVEPQKSTSLYDAAAPIVVRNASYSPAAFNPWYYVFRTGVAYVFLCSSRSECKRARREVLGEP